jgi:hypothetical protein
LEQSLYLSRARVTRPALYICHVRVISYTLLRVYWIVC